MISPELSVAVSITPSDAADIASGYIRAFTVGATGTVAFTTTGGTDGSITAQVGVMYFLKIRRIKAAGTAATGIVGYR